jgi:hypothetical protein
LKKGNVNKIWWTWSSESVLTNRLLLYLSESQRQGGDEESGRDEHGDGVEVLLYRRRLKIESWFKFVEWNRGER